MCGVVMGYLTENTLRRNVKRAFAYSTIGLGSFGVGLYEGVNNSPGLLRSILLAGTPVIGGLVGGQAEVLDDSKEDNDLNQGLINAMEVGMGFVRGGGLAGVCEAAGFGLGKLLFN